MALAKVAVTCDVVDGSDSLLLSGAGYWQPSVTVTDSADHLVVAPTAQLAAVFKPTGSPVVPLLACDNAALLPAGWRWTWTPPSGSGLSAQTFNVQAGPAGFTATSASPAVFTATAPAGQPWVDDMTVTLSGSSLPAGFAAGTTYYLTGVSGSTFSLAATKGGAAIASTSAGSGDVTITGIFLSQVSAVSTAVTTYADNPLTTKGDMVVADSSNQPARLPVGSANEVLTVDSATGEPAWKSAAASSLPLTTLGDLLYEDATPAPARLAGNATTTRKFLRQAGTGSASAAPAWDVLASADIPANAADTTGNAATATNLAGGATVPAYVAPASVALTDGATITVDASLGNDFHVTLGGNRTMDAPSNPVDGQGVTFEVAQDATGSRTLTWASAYSFGSGSAPTLSTAANAVDLVAFRYSARKSQWLYLGSGLGF